MPGIPAQPAHHLDLTVVTGPQIRAREAREVTHDGIRLPETTGARLQHRHLAVGIEGEELRRSVLPLSEIDVNELGRRVEILRDRAGFSRIGGFEIVELHEVDLRQGL
jgi:hypothetical protein